jgi:hypothetical protein
MRHSLPGGRSGWAWAIAGGVAGAGILAVLSIVTALARGAVERHPAAPVVTVLPRPTATAAVTSPPLPTPTETPLPPAPADPEGIRLGGLVEVVGTEGDGLRLRREPSTTGTILALADESEVFTVREGPQASDGRTWFYLVSPSDAARAGWAVADFLRPAN